jgi:hypothetical protein
MSLIETIDLATATAKASPRYVRRHTDDRAAQPRKPATNRTHDPLAATAGVSSRYYRQRIANDRADEEAAALKALAARPPAPTFWTLRHDLPSVDRATSELRRRLAGSIKAEPPERLSIAVTWSLVAGLSMLLWLCLGGMVFALERLM